MVSPAVAALLGALLGAVVTQVVRQYFDRRQRQKELEGLLRLLDGERYRNHYILEYFWENPERITEAGEYVLRLAQWDASKARLARLLSDDTQFADIAKYYENLRTLNDFRRDPVTSEARRQESGHKLLPNLLELSNLTRKHIRSHIPDSVSGTPLESSQGSTLVSASEQQEPSPEGCSWWRRMFGT